MSLPPEASSAERAQLKEKVDLLILERQRSGEWSAGVHAHTDYQTRPLEWIVEKLGVGEETLRWSLSGEEYKKHQWDGDEDPLIQILEGLADWKDVGVESATGTGKTYLAACVTYWFLACWENSIVITAAPTEKLLLLQIWKEIGGLWPRFRQHFPQAELLNGKIRMKPTEGEQEKWAATAFVAGVGASEELAGRAKGFHARDMLIITEETQSIDKAIMTSFAHTRTDDHNLQMSLGNPDHRQDELHRFCVMDAVEHIRISAFDHPNIVTGKSVVPGAIGQRRLAERKVEFGPPNSRIYISQLRGISPAESEEALIRWEWCVAAAEKWKDKKYRKGALALGVDVADSPTGDKAAISRWQGACCTEVVSFQVEDASKLGQRVFLEVTDKDNPVDPRHVGIDSVGVGASTVNEMRRLGLKVRHISGGTRAVPGLDTDLLWSETEVDLEGKLRPTGPTVIQAEKFRDMRSQVWWRLREDLRLGRIALPHDEELWQDLTTPQYGTPNNKITVESKDQIKKRIGRSPDKGDACVYGNFVRRRSPTRTKAKEDLEVDRNRDYGLERYLKRHAKRQAKEKRLLERAFARANRKGKR